MNYSNTREFNKFPTVVPLRAVIGPETEFLEKDFVLKIPFGKCKSKKDDRIVYRTLVTFQA